MPELISLNEALEGILDSITETLTAAKKPGKALAGVQTVVRGDRSRPAPRTPAIWVRGLTAICDQSQRSYAEKWTVDIILLAIVKNDNPDEGYRQATALAAKARSEVLKDRTLGQRKYVQDVKSSSFEMSGPDMQNESLFAATATLQIVLVILENNP